MSERISDEHMRLLQASLAAIENEYTPTCESMSYGNGCPGSTSESIDFWRRAVDCVPSMMAELRERRAADLSAAEIEALKELLGELEAGDYNPPRGSIAAIDRLLAARKP